MRTSAGVEHLHALDTNEAFGLLSFRDMLELFMAEEQPCFAVFCRRSATRDPTHCRELSLPLKRDRDMFMSNAHELSTTPLYSNLLANGDPTLTAREGTCRIMAWSYRTGSFQQQLSCRLTKCTHTTNHRVRYESPQGTQLHWVERAAVIEFRREPKTRTHDAVAGWVHRRRRHVHPRFLSKSQALVWQVGHTGASNDDSRECLVLLDVLQSGQLK